MRLLFHISGPLPRALLLMSLVWGAPLAAPAIPHVDEEAREGFRAFQAAERHRAFVIAPGGAWAWTAGEMSEQAALEGALSRCARYTQQRCVPYAVNKEIRFDAQAWPGLWGPYLDRTAAEQRPTGVKRGRRFPDLAFTDGAGKAHSIADWRGRVTIVHFWGAWCPPCMREFPILQRLQREIGTREEVALVMLQAREPFSASQAWARENGFGDLPLYDSGAGYQSTSLRLADGSQLPDRYFARAFPSTYVLDRHGLVLFYHAGPIDNWSDYLPFIEDAVARSGQ